MEKGGNSDSHVQRKMAVLVRERDGLREDLDEERKLNREMAANKETNERTLELLTKIDHDIALRNTAIKQPTRAGQIGCFPTKN